MRELGCPAGELWTNQILGFSRSSFFSMLPALVFVGMIAFTLECGCTDSGVARLNRGDLEPLSIPDALDAAKGNKSEAACRLGVICRT